MNKFRKTITLILMVLLVHQSIAIAQQKLVTLTLKNVSVKEVIKQIEKQTDFTFVFRRKSQSVGKCQKYYGWFSCQSGI